MQTISDYLESDHQRLDEMLSIALELLDRRDFAKAAEQFADVSYGLDHHINAEEGVLFPAFEKRGGPTQVLRAEHVEIRRWISAVAASLAATNVAEARRGLRRLMDILASHNIKEEHILYPMTDDATDALGRETLVRQMQEI